MDVHIYVLDALRPDFLGCYGASGEISPVIDEFSNESVLFKNAYSTSTWTKPAGTSILTGRYPGSVNMDHVYDQLDPNISILPEILHQYGYKTYGVTAQGFISKKFGLGKGYDQYKNLRKRLSESNIDNARTESGLTSEEKLVLPNSGDLNNAIFPLLNGVKNDLFSFVWSLDTHDPYFVV